MDFEIPESLEGLTLAELRDLADKARAAGRAIAEKDNDDVTTEEFEKATAILNFLAEVDGEIETQEQAEADRAATLETLRGATAKDDKTDDEDEDEDEEPVDESGADAEAAADAEVDETEKEPVVASARKTVTARAAQRAKPVDTVEEDVVERPKATIAASASLKTWSSGQHLEDIGEAARYVAERLKDLPTGGRTRTKLPALQITKGRNDGLVAGATMKDDLQEVLNRARDESRLPGGSLTAAAGWCAPSETVYDIAPHLATTEGLWSVPEVQVARGGLRFTKGPHFADFFAMTSFDLTEAQIEAHDPEDDGPLKDLFSVPCPDFQDVRLDAIGYGVTAGLLQRAGYPEVIDNYLAGGLIGHAHRRDSKLLQRALAITGAGQTLTNVFPNATSLLTALELVVLGERQRYRLGLSQTLEVVLPVWIKGAIRADLSQRTGVDMLNVTDQQIQTFFATRGANVQFVYNWQMLTLGGTNNVNAATDYPSTVQALIYPAGTFTVLSDDVISISTIYDYDQLRNNEYTEIFFEEGVALANTRHDAKRITLPLSVSGLTAAPNINQDWGSAGPLNAVPTITVTA